VENKQPTQAEYLQTAFFGLRYAGKTIGTCRFPRGDIERITEWTKNPKNFLVIVGPAGTGKTHFSSAMIEFMLNKVNSLRAYTEDDLLRRVRQKISEGNGDYIEYLRGLVDDNFIIIDDVGSSGHTDWREEIIFETINYRYETMWPTLITSNLLEADFYQIYGQRIASRLFAKENTIIDLSGMKDLRQEGK
jgi:DNA replication protein DnaC